MTKTVMSSNTNHHVTQLYTLNSNHWHAVEFDELTTAAQRTSAIEKGSVFFFPNLAFLLSPEEQALLSPQLTNPKHKNISLQKNNYLKGLRGSAAQHNCALAMISRYQQYTRVLINHLFPHYQHTLRTEPTSLRLHRVEARHTSWRKDDTRLHIDAFPSRPNHGERILRVFTNISPNGEARVWRIGAPFENIAQQFIPRTRSLLPGAAWLMHQLGITKRVRSAYDQLMLQLHDAMKSDQHYQNQGAQQTMHFPAGSTWVCYSDQVPHAVMAGQFMLEQTYFLAPQDMMHPEYAPLSILQGLTQKKLI